MHQCKRAPHVWAATSKKAREYVQVDKCCTVESGVAMLRCVADRLNGNSGMGALAAKYCYGAHNQHSCRG